MNKKNYILSALSIYFLLAGFVLAQNIEGTGVCTEQYDPVCGSDGVTYSNLCFALKSGVAPQYKGECSTKSIDNDFRADKVRILPTSRFYFLKEWGRALKRAITFNPIAKTQLELKIADEKAAELKKLEETQPQNVKAIKKALASYENSQERLKTHFENLKNASQNPNVDKLLEKIAERNVKHAELFNELEKKFEEKQELRDLVVKNKESLKDAPKAVPEQIVSSRCEIWKNACNWGPVLGEKPKIKPDTPCAPPGSLSPLPTCPPEEPPIKGVSRDGPVDYCALYEMFCLGKSPLQVKIPDVCTEQYDPVCGSDGVTYSNLCFALKSGVAPQYKGECGKEKKEMTKEELKNYNKKLNDIRVCGIQPGAPGNWVCEGGGWKLKKTCDPAGAISDNMECEDGVWRYKIPKPE